MGATTLEAKTAEQARQAGDAGRVLPACLDKGEG